MKQESGQMQALARRRAITDVVRHCGVIRYGALTTVLLAVPCVGKAQSFLGDVNEHSVREVAPEPDDPEEPVAKPTAGVGNVSYEQHAASGAREGSGYRGTVALDQMTVSTGFPIFFDGANTMLAVGLNYARTRFDYTGATDVSATEFHTFRPTFTFRHSLDDRWGVVLRYVPNLTTNMTDVTFGHVSHGGQIIGTYQMGPNETFYFGLAYCQAVPTYMLPGVGYELYSGRMHVELRMPEKFEVGYMLTPRVEVGATTRYQSTLFGIGGVSQLDRISYTTIWSGLNVDVRIVAGLHLRGSLGRTLYRRFRGQDDGEQTRAIALEQTMVGKVGLSYEIDR